MLIPARNKTRFKLFDTPTFTTILLVEPLCVKTLGAGVTLDHSPSLNFL